MFFFCRRFESSCGSNGKFHDEQQSRKSKDQNNHESEEEDVLRHAIVLPILHLQPQPWQQGRGIRKREKMVWRWSRSKKPAE